MVSAKPWVTIVGMPPIIGKPELAPDHERVPSIDLTRVWDDLEAEFQGVVARVARTGQFLAGAEVDAFEAEWAGFCGVRHGIACASGTDALTLAMAACELGPGDEVITSTLGSAATATAIVRAGGTPILVDVERESLNLDLRKVEDRISGRTRLLLPVHLYGRPVRMGTLTEIAETAGVEVIEDACQAHGAQLSGKRIGGFGKAACFSFYPTKNLGAFGDGGIVTTDLDHFAQRLRMLRQMGQRDRDRTETLGFTSRLDELQAGFLRCKLRRLDAWNARRIDIARLYREAIDDLAGVRLPAESEGHVYHQFVIRVHDRERVRSRLADRGIKTEVHYRVPLHRQQPFREAIRLGDQFPEADLACAEVISLPIFPELRDVEIEQVADALKMAIVG